VLLRLSDLENAYNDVNVNRLQQAAEHFFKSCRELEAARLDEAGEYDITIEQGSGFSLAPTYEAPEGSLVDFIGSTARLHVHTKYGATEKLIELATENGVSSWARMALFNSADGQPNQP
jgi:hypothetical protein